MGFYELRFLFLFLPVFAASYYFIPSGARRIWSCLGSLAFYLAGTWNYPAFVCVLLGFIALSWLASRFLTGRKWLFICLEAGLFGSLLFCKYAGILGVSVVLPLGMSFFCFQISAYLTDVYRGEIEPEPNFWTYASAILLFPKLISGPLMNSEDMLHQVRNHEPIIADLDMGLRDFIVGLSVKTLLADRIGSLWTQVGNLGYESISAPLAWLGLIAFSLQLYFDFWGYSRMAVGLGRMLGFRLPENFCHPYAAKSVRDFWRRWHITLGAWFKRYVYIPLGGSRKGTDRFVLSTMAVWLFTGMWHGSTVNYVFWGLLLGLLILNERMWLGKILDRVPAIGHIYTPIVIGFSWLLFALPKATDIPIYIERMFDLQSFTGALDFSRYGKSYLGIVCIGLLFALPYPLDWLDKLKTKTWGIAVLLVLFWACVYCICVSANDPFLYFSF